VWEIWSGVLSCFYFPKRAFFNVKCGKTFWIMDWIKQIITTIPNWEEKLPTVKNNLFGQEYFKHVDVDDNYFVADLRSEFCDRFSTNRAFGE
jgi:hypothetical protein